MEKISGLSLDIIPKPGETLKELLVEKNMTQKELAIRLGITEKTITGIIHGLEPISEATAIKLEVIFGISASFWNNLQANYNILIERQKNLNSVTEEEKNLINDKTYKKLVDFKIIENKKDKTTKVLSLRKLLGISNLCDAKCLLEIQGCFRKSNQQNIDYLGLLIWLKLCEKFTEKNQVDEINLEKLKEQLNYIKSLSKEPPKYFMPKLKKVFSECGIDFHVIPDFPNVPIHGYIEKKSEKIILCLTIRYKFADIFWFSLFHELGHIFNGDIKQKFYDFNLNDNEKAADKFAQETLISPITYEDLIMRSNIDLTEIKKCAAKNHIDTGIIVGRLYHDKVIKFGKFANERKRYYLDN